VHTYNFGGSGSSFTIICRTMGLKVGMITYVQIVGWPAPQKFGRAKNLKIWSDFGQLLTLTRNILGNVRDIKNPKQTWSTTVVARLSKKNLVKFGPLTKML